MICSQSPKGANEEEETRIFPREYPLSAGKGESPLRRFRLHLPEGGKDGGEVRG